MKYNSSTNGRFVVIINDYRLYPFDDEQDAKGFARFWHGEVLDAVTDELPLHAVTLHQAEMEIKYLTELIRSRGKLVSSGQLRCWRVRKAKFLAAKKKIQAYITKQTQQNGNHYEGQVSPV